MKNLILAILTMTSLNAYANQCEPKVRPALQCQEDSRAGDGPLITVSVTANKSGNYDVQISSETRSMMGGLYKESETHERYNCTLSKDLTECKSTNKHLRFQSVAIKYNSEYQKYEITKETDKTEQVGYGKGFICQ